MNMRYALSLLLFLFMATTGLLGQQPGHYSFYMFNGLNWNPAYAGMDGSLSFTGIYRKQWVGLEGSPSSQHFSAHMPLYIASGGVGINFENDRLGAEGKIGATLAYNYQLPLADGVLAIGLAGGIRQHSLDGDKLRTPEGNYTEPDIIEHNDNLLFPGRETAIAPTFSAGVYYKGEWLEIGLSARNITENSASFSTFTRQDKRTFFATAMAHFEIGDAFLFHPSVFMRSDLVQTQTDLTLRVEYNRNIFGGVSFRGYNSNSIDAVVMLLGLNVSETFRIGYAYDLTLSDLNVVSNGSHEFVLTYNLNKPIGQGRPPNIIYNPRSL